MNNTYYYDFPVSGAGAATSGNIAFTGASASVTLPAGIETLMLITTNPVHFRISVGAATALTTDPMIVSGMSPIIVKLADSSVAYTLSAIQDSATTTNNLNWAKVAEG